MQDPDLQQLIEKKIEILRKEGIKEEDLERVKNLQKEGEYRKALEFLIFLTETAIAHKQIEVIGLRAELAQKVTQFLSSLNDPAINSVLTKYNQELQEIEGKLEKGMEEISRRFEDRE